jgi:PAS domain S-box-containing protein
MESRTPNRQDDGLRALIEALGDPALMLRAAPDGRLQAIGANPAFDRLFGEGAARAAAAAPLAFCPELGPAARQVQDGRSTESHAVHVMHAEGQEMPCTVSVFAPAACDAPTLVAIFTGVVPPPDPVALWHAPAHLRTIVDGLPVPLFIKDAAFRIVLMNRACEEAMGLRFEDLRGTDGSRFFPPEMMADFLAIDRQVFAGGVTIDREERSWNAAERRETIRRTVKTPVYDDAGRPQFLIGCSIDVTAQRRSEAQLRDTLAELARRNDDLRDFAAFASHDLQEPLRKVRTLAERLVSGGLDAEAARGSLLRMVAAVGRMQELIDGLLAYSRTSAETPASEPVDLSVVLAAVVEDLDALRERSGGRIEVGPLPVVDGDPALLRQVFQNLIANGLKFHAPGVPPRVRVGAEPAAFDDGRPAWRFTVEDDGIGFDAAQAERIFAPLVRLRRREEYAGSGIGLAIVRRAVERHGGTVRARPGQSGGAVFEILLPQRPDGANAA